MQGFRQGRHSDLHHGNRVGDEMTLPFIPYEDWRYIYRVGTQTAITANCLHDHADQLIGPWAETDRRLYGGQVNIGNPPKR